MAIVQFARFKSDKPEEMVKAARQGKAIFEKHGAEFLRLSGFTPARGPESGSSRRATRVGKLMERCRRQWRRTRHSRS
jgi:hypothetical protein